MFFIPFNPYLLALSDLYPVVYFSLFLEGSAEETRGGWEEGRVGGVRWEGGKTGGDSFLSSLLAVVPFAKTPRFYAALVSRDRVQMIKRGLGSIH